jgi:hypothetical protein
MSAVLPFVRPMNTQRADGVFAAVNIAARAAQRARASE